MMKVESSYCTKSSARSSSSSRLTVSRRNNESPDEAKPNQVSTKSSHSIEDFRLKASLREHRLACRKRTNNESRDSERHGRNIPFHVNQTLQPCRPVHVPYKDNETKLNPMSKSGMSTLLFQENQHRTSFSHQARKYKP